MKIFFLITELHEGGAENAFFHTAVELKRRGHEIHVASLHGGDGAVAQRLRDQGMAVFDLGLRRPWHLWKLLKLRRYIRELAPDWIYSWLFHANLAAKLCCGSIPLAIGLRVLEPRSTHLALEKIFRSRVKTVFAVSREVLDWASHTLGYPAEICHYTPNGVDPTPFAGIVRQAWRPGQPLRLLTVARKTRQKGLDILVEALAMLPPESDWSWTLVGEEPESDYLEELHTLITRFGLKHRIEFRPKINRDQLPSIYAAHNLFVLPSRWEGQANVVLEAAAAGLPVLCSEHCGYSADEVHALKLDPRDWAFALTDILLGKRTPAKPESLAQLSSGYSFSRNAEFIEDIFITRISNA